jgi:beta-N-acetylhexosaminidase
LTNEAAFFADAQPWGFILFARNCENPDQLRRLTGALRNALGRDAPILIDQEGGRVQRMWPPYWRAWRPALDQVMDAGPAGATRSMYLRARLIAAELHDVGIDVNCAPLADVARDTTHPFLKNRLYGFAPDDVVGAARAVAQGLLDGGVLPVIKHIPGHGHATVDSHLGLPRVNDARAELDRIDFAPFAALADLPMGMTAHLVYDALDPDLPATFSATMIDLIRDRIGFRGLLMTDDLSMGALPGPIGERAARARAAGVDVILHCNGDMAEMADVVAAAGDLSGVAGRRADAALAARSPPAPLDIPDAEAELGALLRGQVYV